MLEIMLGKDSADWLYHLEQDPENGNDQHWANEACGLEITNIAKRYLPG